VGIKKRPFPHQVLPLDALTQLHLEPGRLLQVDVEGLHDGGVQVVGVVGQQVGIDVVADVPVVDVIKLILEEI